MSRGINAFSSPDDQASMIAQWREKVKETGSRVLNLRTKIKRHKQETEKQVKIRKLVEDLEALEKEQGACERKLLGMQVYSTDDGLAVRDLRSTLLRKLTEIRACQMKTKQGAIQLTDVQQKIASFKSFIQTRYKSAMEEEDELTSDSLAARDGLKSNIEAELRALFLNAEQKISPQGSSSDMHDNRSPFLEALKLEEEEVFSQLDGILCSPVTSDPLVYQTAEKILRIDQESRKRSPKIVDTNFLIDRMKLALPGVATEAIKVALAEAEQGQAVTVHCRRLLHHAKAAVEWIVAACLAHVAGSQMEATLQKSIEAEMREQNEKKELLQAKLSVQRRVYSEKNAAHQRHLEEEALVRRREEEAKERQRLKEFQARLRLLEEYEQRKKEFKEKEEELRQIKEQQENEQKIERMAVNGKRVEFRQLVLEERLKDQKEREEELERIREKKEAAIQRFFDSIHEKLGVEGDFNRLLQQTKSSEQTKSYVSFAEAGMVNLHGYSDEKIMSDPRVRLYHALLEAGLHKSIYGRQKVTEGYHIPRAQQLSDGNPFGGYF